MLKAVRVKGEAQALWQTLLGTLYAHQYEVEAQSPYTELKAKRGSKVSSLVLEGTKGGFRELNVTFLPEEGTETEVRFEFVFPSWAITLAGTKQECSDLVDEFAGQAGQGAEPGPVAAGTTTVPTGQTGACASCGAQVRPRAKFCDSCGAALTAKGCAKCGAAMQPAAKFCDNCGARV
jgi:hypothetical protein